MIHDTSKLLFDVILLTHYAMKIPLMLIEKHIV